MDKLASPRAIDVLVFDGVNLLDVAGPVQAFEAANIGGRPAYVHRFVSPDGCDARASCGLILGVAGALSATSKAQDLLIPGGGVETVIPQAKVLETLRAWVARPGEGRVISICSGALILAAAGVLDGHSATTHWSRASDVAAYPQVAWDLDRIGTETGRLYTSAGVSTGIDLALAIIRKDCGNAVALSVARELVVQLRRSGGQSQYAAHLAGQFTEDDRLSRVIEQVTTDPRGDWSSAQLALAAGMNARTLTRRFKAHLGKTPAQFVERVRVDHARAMLGRRLPLKQVAAESGFGDLQRMRRAFRRQLHTDPASYVAAFGREAEC